MGKRKRYSVEMQQELVRLVRAGRTPEQLAAEFEPSAQAIRNWVKQAELDEGTLAGLQCARWHVANDIVTPPITAPRSKG